MFCWPDGRPLYPDTITEQFGKLVDRARLPQIRLHDVRHTYGTMALRAEINPKIVSTRLGHATVAFTLDTYTADVPDLDRAAAEQISGLFLPPAAARGEASPAALRRSDAQVAGRAAGLSGARTRPWRLISGFRPLVRTR
jgi:hypothetical protein